MKRLLTLLMALCLILSFAPFSVLAEEGENTAETVEDEVSVEGTGSLGKLISKAVEESENTSGNDGNPGSIADVTVTGTTAVVEYSTLKDVELVVAVYTEDGTQMLGSGVTRVTAETDVTEVAITIDEMPEYFTVGAFLLAEDSHEPLSEEYISRQYTQEFQEFLNMTTEDFDEDRVLNLDEDEATNYLVFSEGTVMAEETAGVNEITDNGDGTYTIRNADERFLHLQSGDSFSYTYEDGSVLIVVVASILVDGTTVTVIEETDASLEEVFDFVRIDAENGDGELEADLSTADEGVELAKETNAQRKGAKWGGEGSNTKSISINIKKKFGSDAASASITGSLSLSVRTKLKVYISNGWKYVKFVSDHSLRLTAGVTGKLKGSISLGKYGIPLGAPGVYASLEPALVLEFSAAIEAECGISWSNGFEYDNNAGLKKIKETPKPSSSFEFEGTIFIGLDMDIGVSVVTSKILRFSIEGEVGVEASAKLTPTTASSSFQHDCNTCLDGELYFLISVKVKFETLFDWLYKEVKLFDTRIKFSEFYYSFDFNEFGWSTCPHIRYLVTATVTGPKGDVVSGAEIKGTRLASAPVTDGDGKVSFYLPNGEYTFEIDHEDFTFKKAVTIQDGAKSLDIRLGYGESTASGQCGDNLTWEFFSNYSLYRNTLVISGTGDMWDYDDSNKAPWHDYCKSGLLYWIRCNLIINDGITSIGNNAFDNCNLIDAVSIPNSVLNIGQEAFWGCNNLEEIYIPGSVQRIGDGAFAGCGRLKTITISEGVTEIGSRVFPGWTRLEIISFPASLTRIDGPIFDFVVYGVDGNGTSSSLSRVEVNEGNPYYTSVDGVLFTKDMTELLAYPAGAERTAYNFPAGVEVIRENAFRSCNHLTDVIINDGVTVIEELAFYNCKNLTAVMIPGSITTIGYGAFQECTSLLSIEIPNGVKRIEGATFRECSSLISVTIGNGVTSIGSQAFYKCSSLASIIIPDGIEVIEDEAFGSCTLLADVTIPESVTTIGWSGFAHCGMTRLTIPGSVSSIGQYVLANCEELRTVTIKDGVPYIPQYMLIGCNNLESIYIPVSVTSIGYNAFSSCNSLRDIYYAGDELQWAAISKLGVIIPSAVTIHYNYASSSNATPAEPLFEEPADQVNGTEIESETGHDREEEMDKTAEMPVPDFEAEELEERLIGEVDGTDAEETSILTAESLAAYTGTVTESGEMMKIASFSELVPGEEYVFIVSYREEDMLLPDYLLFIAQGTAEQDGTLSFVYVPREEASDAVIRAYGKSNKDLSEAVVTFERQADGSYLLTVVYDGIILEEDKDYYLTFDVGDGVMTVIVTGRMDYAGRNTITIELIAVTFESNGGSNVRTQFLNHEGKATRPEDPTRDGYIFEGWFTDEECTTAYDFDTVVTENVILYAGWKAIPPVASADLEIGSAATSPGKEVQIPVSLVNNPGIASFQLDVQYDDAVLEWTGLEKASIGGTWDASVGERILWIDADNYTGNGVIFTLTFKVKDDAAAGMTTVTVTYDEDNVFDKDGNSVALAVVPGTITIKTHTPGDINGDGSVNNKDLLWLMKYIKGKDVVVVEEALDVNGDGNRNNKDLLWLMKYLKGKDVVIY